MGSMWRIISLLLATGLATQTRANPIRKVVTLLQGLARKVGEEGEKDAELFEKFKCYCKTNEASLRKTIEDGTDRISQLESSVKEEVGKKSQTEKELAQHKKDRAEATEAMASAQAIRDKEAASFSDESNEAKNNIKGLERAIPALEKGITNFLQTGNAALVRKLFVANSDNMNRADREMLSSFLQGSSEYAPSSNEIVGILKQMKEQMESDLADITKTEDAAVKSHEEMMGAQKKEIAAATKAIEEKTSRIGAMSVNIANQKNDLKETTSTNEEDSAFLRTLTKDCATKTTQFDERQKMRSEEQQAISSTIKVLNDDDALDLFKKTVPNQGGAFIQMAVSSKSLQKRALHLIQTARLRNSDLRLNFIALALRGKKVGFEKLSQIIQNMIKALKAEQAVDEKQLGYCKEEFNTNGDKKRDLGRDLKSVTTSISEKSDTLKSIEAEVAELKAGIVALDRSVKEATSQRQKENKLFVSETAASNTAVQLLEFAKNNLNKFYNPKLYKPPPPAEMSEEDRVYAAMGGELDPTPAPGGIAGTGIGFLQMSARMRGAPPVGSYEKKSGQSTGIISMIDSLLNDLKREVVVAETEEKEAQADYSDVMEKSSKKREADSKSITEKSSQLAEMETELGKIREEQKGTLGELVATNEVISKLHGECDFLVQNFAARKEARASEVESLTKANAVLAGADFSFLQTKFRVFRGRV